MTNAPTHLAKGDYLLGAAEIERARLGTQHALWRPTVLADWDRAGFAPGMHLLDVGAGPGHATRDLLDRVGHSGSVTAVERATESIGELGARFGDDARCRIVDLDLTQHEIPLRHCGGGTAGYDGAWCRWVAMFLEDVDGLVGRIARALRPGGVAVFHEYLEYRTYRVMPEVPEVREFVEHAIAGLRRCGGDANAATRVLASLDRHGLELVAQQAHPVTARPDDPWWQWPAGFIRVFVPRQVELGLATREWGDRTLAALAAAERSPDSVIVAPLNMVLIARKR